MKSNVKSVVSKLTHIKLPSFKSQHWLYQHHLLLARLDIVTDEQAKQELTMVAKNQVRHNKFEQAMSTICKLHDLFNWNFYDENNYEPVPLAEIKKRLHHFAKKLLHSK